MRKSISGRIEEERRKRIKGLEQGLEGKKEKKKRKTRKSLNDEQK